MAKHLPTSLSQWLILVILSLLLHHHLSLSSASASPHFDGFPDDDIDIDDFPPIHLINPPTLTQSDPITHLHTPSQPSDQNHDQDQHPPPSPTAPEPEFWDEEEFEGLPQLPPESPKITPNATPELPDSETLTAASLEPQNAVVSNLSSFSVEISCVAFFIMFVINYFAGKRHNDKLALFWATKFAIKNSVFDKNFTLVGVGEGEESPLLLKEGHNVFKFYASGRKFCQGMLAIMELKSRHDLISRVYNFVVSCKDEISFEVYMNGDAMDQVVFAVAKKKVLDKELIHIQRFAGLVASPTGRKWVSEDLAVFAESREVASDLITEAVLDQVFGEKAFEKFGNSFISMHFSDQQPGIHKKKLIFKFALPEDGHMEDMVRLVALVPYYIDLIGRYKLSSQVRSKTDGARVKAAQEAQKEMQNARQAALQRKKVERRKMIEEVEAKLSAEAIRKKEAKERARQMKKAMPKTKTTRAK